MATKYSASRIGSFASCKLKYDLSYRRGYYAEEIQQSVVTRKGNAFHTFAENYQPSWTEEIVAKKQFEYETKYQIPEEYSLTAPIRKFIAWYDAVIKPATEAGAIHHREIQFDFELDGNKFTGKLDVLLEYPDGSFYIIDYKTSKGTNTSYHADQMLLYAWALHKQYKVPVEQMIEKIKIGIFFSFAGDPDADPLKSFKTIKFADTQLSEVRKYYKDYVTLIESNTWAVEAGFSKLCEYCSFCGMKQYCPDSAKAGLYPTRGVKILQKQWAIDQDIK